MDDVKPTARWANRMLRPLASIYRRLEKHYETLAIIAADPSTNHPPNIHTHSKNINGAVEVEGHGSGSDVDESDPVWVPGRKPDQRRVRHKYSARGEGKGGRRRTRNLVHSPEATRSLPGAIELATPVITGKRWEAPSSARSQVSTTEYQKVPKPYEQLQAFREKYPLHKSPWQELLDQSGDTGLAGIIHNLDRILQNFLCNTRITKRETNDVPALSARGTRSLMSTVMRRLPEFITKEQDAQDELEENGDEDMCDAYFTELENFYAPYGHGWKPLREAVRAQGIHLVSNMIVNKWLTDPITCALIEKCRYHEPDACESLLSVFLSTCTGYPYPIALKSSVASNEPGDPVRLLRRYAHYAPAHRSYIFDELSKLLRRKVLPPEWMATKSWTSWMTRATISFSKVDDDYAAASRLIEAVLASAAGILPCVASPALDREETNNLSHGEGRQTRMGSTTTSGSNLYRKCPLPVEDALSNHVTSLLAALCGMHISRSREFHDPNDFEGTQAGNIISYLFFTLEEDMISRQLSKSTTLTSHQLLRQGSILVADCLLQCNDAVINGGTRSAVGSTPVIERFCEMLTPRSGLVKELSLFVRQAFRCFGGHTDEERISMGREVRGLICRLPILTNSSSLSTLLGKVAMEAAMEFAESTGEPEDHLWAIEVQETVNSLLREKKPSGEEYSAESWEPQQRSGCYRWEESIGEWVARTPAVKMNSLPTAVAGGRPGVPSVPVPCIPCSTDSSSPNSDQEFDHESERILSTPSSLTSSPPSAGFKRAFDGTGSSSPLRSAKRRRPVPVIVQSKERNRTQRDGRLCTTIAAKSSSMEPLPTQRRILRELSNRAATSQVVSTREKSATQVEVVILNSNVSNTNEPYAPPSPEPELEVIENPTRRAVEPRRSRRSRISVLPRRAPRMVTRRRSMVIPCSDEDSDDELSFL